MLDCKILGVVEVSAGDEVARPSAPKQRALLAALLLNVNRVLTMDRLVDAVWESDPPRSAVANVRTYAMSLRRVLTDGEPRLVTSAEGYLLRLSVDELDATRFTRLAGLGRAAITQGDPRAAADHLGAALALWRHDHAGVGINRHGPLMQWLTALDEQRRQCVDDYLDARLALGADADLIADIRRSVIEDPLREQRWGQLMLATYRTGDVSGALRCWTQAREAITEGLGVDPGPELRRLHQGILNRDPSLTLSPGDPAPGLSHRDRAHRVSPRDLASPISRHDLPPSTSHSDQTPRFPHADLAPRISHADLTPRVPQRDLAPSTSHRDLASPASQRDLASPISHRDHPPGLSDRDRTPGLSDRDRTPGLSDRDRTPGVFDRDQAGRGFQGDRARGVSPLGRAPGGAGPEFAMGRTAFEEGGGRPSPAGPRLAPTPQQLPPAPGVLAGRRVERDTVVRALRDGGSPPVVVICGPAGVGTSALAASAAAVLAPDYPDGQLYLDLTETRDPAATLVRELDGPAPQPAARLRSILADRRLLLLLDNVSSAAEVRALLPATSTSGVLIAARSPLTTLDTAATVRLSPLAHSDALDMLAGLIGEPAVAGCRDDAARLVHACGHLPLAIRIAAARLLRRTDWSLAHAANRLLDGGLDEFEADDLSLRDRLLAGFRSLSPRSAAALVLFGRLGTARITAGVVAQALRIPAAAAAGALDELTDRQFVTAAHGRYRVLPFPAALASELAKSPLAGDAELVTR